MVKPTYTIAMAAVLMVAAFAGIMLVNDEVDAADTADLGSIAYTDGSNGRSIAIEDGATTITILGPADAGVKEAGFEYWTSTSGVIYKAGATVAISAISSSDVEDGVFTLTAYYGEPSTTVDFIVGEDVTEVEPTDTSAELAVPADPTPEDGFAFAGWKYSNDGKVYSADEIKKLEDAPVAGETFTAVFEQLYTVTWSVDGTVISTQYSNEVSQPEDPYKENYIFEGWSVNGEIVSDVVAGEIKVPADYEFTADTVFVAEFEPIQLTITLMVGETKYGTVPALFGEPVVAPALPPGYAAWATREQVPVLDDEGNPVLDEAGNPTYEYEYTVFEFPANISANTTLYAIESTPDENVYVTFNIEGQASETLVVSDRLTVPSTDREGYNFLGWTIQGQDVAMMSTEKVQSDIRAGVYTEDTTFVAVYEVAEPPAPEEPAFYETTTGQVAIIIVVFVLLLFGYAVYSNMGGLKDKLFGYTISKKEKKE